MKNLLFVCIENSCRSQMAEGFANYFGKGIVKAYSAGSKPSGKVNPQAIKVMGEEKINISGHEPKGFDALHSIKFDYAITLGCQDVCPFIPANRHIEWNITDPKGKNIAAFRRVRDKIKDKVRGIVDDLAKKGKTQRGGK